MRAKMIALFLLSFFLSTCALKGNSSNTSDDKSIAPVPPSDMEVVTENISPSNPSAVADVLAHAYSIRDKEVSISPSKGTYHIGDLIHFTVRVPISGYLNIVSIEPDGKISVLFPNKYNSNNWVEAGSEVNVPDDIGGFRLRAIQPAGRSVVYAFVTTKKINLYEWARQFGSGKGSVFAEIPDNSKSADGLRSILVEQNQGNEHSGDMSEYNLCVGRVAVEILE